MKSNPIRRVKTISLRPPKEHANRGGYVTSGYFYFVCPECGQQSNGKGGAGYGGTLKTRKHAKDALHRHMKYKHTPSPGGVSSP